MEKENRMQQNENGGHCSVFHCSFCHKRRDQVEDFIAGPDGIFICAECVELCWEIICAKRQEREDALRRSVKSACAS